MRGDRPVDDTGWTQLVMFTPHARGSTAEIKTSFLELKVYPACAGIDRTCSAPLGTMFCLPRMRGDRPRRVTEAVASGKFTPHARGSTRHPRSWRPIPVVYPACAGIDLYNDDQNLLRPCLPRMRGDRPTPVVLHFRITTFTPHARGSTFEKT